MDRIFLIGFFVVLCWSCSGTKPIASNTSLDAMVASQRFEIISQWVSPMLSRGVMAISNSGLLAPGSTAGRIDLTGNQNFLKVKDDTISAYLPYFGERQMGGGYNSNSAVEFKGVPNTFEMTQDPLKKNHTMRFTITEKSENYLVFVTIMPDLSTTISINSSQRDAINYYGQAKSIQE